MGILLPLPLGFYLARVERTRWGSLSLCFTAVVVAVMTLRLMQLWQAGLADAAPAVEPDAAPEHDEPTTPRRPGRAGY